MPKTTLTIPQKLARERTLLEELIRRIDQFNEVDRVWLYNNYWPEYADREAPRLLRNLKSRRSRVIQRIWLYESMLSDM